MDPKELKKIGQAVADLYGAGRGSLSEIAASMLQGKDLGMEQVQRVVEFANNAAFGAAFPKMAGAIRIVDFPDGPADPKRVLELLAKPASSEEEEGVAIMKTARLLHDVERFVPGAVLLDEEALTMEKRASAGSHADYPPRTPNRELYELWSRAKTAEGVVEAELRSKFAAYVHAGEDMCVAARRAMLDGVNPASVAQAFHELSPTPALTKLALGLIRDAVRDVPAVEERREPGAVYVLDRTHAVCTGFEKFASTARDYYTYLAAKEKLAQGRKQIQTLINGKEAQG
jgi:hypothetical protein